MENNDETLYPGELVYSKRQRNKRVAQEDEIISLINDTGGITRQMVQNFTGSSSNRLMKSLKEGGQVNVEALSGLNVGQPTEVYYSGKNFDIGNLLRYMKLSMGVWYLKEMGYQTGRVTLQKGTCLLPVAINDKEYVPLALMDINDVEAEKTKLTRGYTQVIVTESIQEGIKTLRKIDNAILIYISKVKRQKIIGGIMHNDNQLIRLTSSEPELGNKVKDSRLAEEIFWEYRQAELNSKMCGLSGLNRGKLQEELNEN